MNNVFRKINTTQIGFGKSMLDFVKNEVYELKLNEYKKD